MSFDLMQCSDLGVAQALCKGVTRHILPDDYRMLSRLRSTTICRMIGRPFSTTRGALHGCTKECCMKNTTLHEEHQLKDMLFRLSNR